MTRWKIETKEFDDREHDYSAGFLCTNTETGATVHLMVTQRKGSPATDLVSSLTALARVFHRVDREQDASALDGDVQTVTLKKH